MYICVCMCVCMYICVCMYVCMYVYRPTSSVLSEKHEGEDVFRNMDNFEKVSESVSQSRHAGIHTHCTIHLHSSYSIRCFQFELFCVICRSTLFLVLLYSVSKLPYASSTAEYFGSGQSVGTSGSSVGNLRANLICWVEFYINFCYL